MKGETQYRNHLKSKSHRKALQAITDKVYYEMKIVGFSADNKKTAAKVLKNIFSIGLIEVMSKLDNIPSVLTREHSLKKAKKIAKELEKIGIVTDIQRVSESACPE